MGPVLATPAVVPNIVEELPADQTNNQTPSITTNGYGSMVQAANRPIESRGLMWSDYFRAGTSGEEGVTIPGPLWATPAVVDLNIVEEPPADTINIGYPYPVLPANRPIESLGRIRADYFWPGTSGEEGVMTPEPLMVALNIVVEEPPADQANNQTSSITNLVLAAANRPIASLGLMWTDYFRPGTSGEEGVTIPGPLWATPAVVALNIVEEPPADHTNNQTSSITNLVLAAANRPIASLGRMWTDYFRPGMLREEAVMIPVVDEEAPAAETITETFTITNACGCLVPAAKRLIELFCREWTRYFPLGEEGLMKPGSAVKLVIIGLLGFAAIKSQGGTKFPFQTHPRTSMVSVTSLLMYGLASKAEDFISTRPNSVYAIRLVGKLSLFTLNYGVEKS